MTEQVGLRAHKEWAVRPKDECFATLEDAGAYLEERMNRSREYTVDLSSVGKAGGFVADSDGEVRMNVTPQDGGSLELGFSNFGFQAVGKLIAAHPEFLGRLQASTAADALNDLFANCLGGGNIVHQEDEANIGPLSKLRKLLTLKSKTPGELEKVRAVNGTGYGRVWDSFAYKLITDLFVPRGFGIAPMSYRDEARGIYAGDRSCFFFLVDESKSIEVKRPGGQVERLSRGVMVWNSEVGLRKFGMCQFLYQYICGNHMIWGMDKARTLETRHVGNALDRIHAEIVPEITALLEETTANQSGLLARAMQTRYATNGEDAARNLTKEFGFSKKLVQEALLRAKMDPDNEGLDPLSFFAIFNGLTSQARDMGQADARTKLEVQASKFLESATRVGTEQAVA